MRNFPFIPTLAGLAALGLLACTQAPFSPATISTSALRVDAARSTIYTGENVQLQAVVVDGSERQLETGDAIWSSSEPNVASVSPDGLVQGVQRGSAEITASYGGETAKVTIGVVQSPACATALGVPQGCPSQPQ
jgi:uncharacterized protein YjdB